ncbi:MAG TPA: methionyl-tRNA formyltransferase [Bacillota bacterium]
MRLLFMGTPEFAAASLEHLIRGGYDIIGAVTQPDRPKGRGMELQPSAVKTVALKHGLRLWQPMAVAAPEFLEQFTEINPDLVIVVAFGQKIPPQVLYGPKYGCINVHGSLLPKYRGAAPIQWSIINGDSTTGVTTMYMDEGWDTGDIIYQETVNIGINENFTSLYKRLAELGGRLLVKTVHDIAAGTAPRSPQDSSAATKAPKPGLELTRIRWDDPTARIHNLVRALNPSPGVETIFNQERLKILESDCPADLEKSQGTSVTPPPEPGMITALIKKRGILVATGDGNILVTQVQPSGKRPMLAIEYANGRRLQVEMKFT